MQVGSGSNPNSQDVLNEPFINEQYEPGSKSYDDAAMDAQNVRTYGCFCTALRAFVWWTFGMGLAMSIWWFICGLLFGCWFSACSTISKYLLFGQMTKRREITLHSKCACYNSHGQLEQNCCCDPCCIAMWSCTLGLMSFVMHFTLALWTFPFLIFGWKFTVIHWRLCKVVLFNPHGVEIKGNDHRVRGEGIN